MGTTQSQNNYNIIDFNKKLYIVINLFLKPKYEETSNFDIDNLKTNSFLKKKLKDIIVKSFTNKFNCNITLYENNIILVSKSDNNNIKYLEMNAMIEFGNIVESKPKIDIVPTSVQTYIYPKEILNNSSNDVSIPIIKMAILHELHNYVIHKWPILTPDITLIILYETIYTIEIFQK